jgi:two-component sensor histidine kinase
VGEPVLAIALFWPPRSRPGYEGRKQADSLSFREWTTDHNAQRNGKGGRLRKVKDALASRGRAPYQKQPSDAQRNGALAVSHTRSSDALEMTSQRIQTMAEVYDHLMLRDQTKIVDLKEYIGDIVRRLMALSGDKPVAVRCELDEAYAHSEVAASIAIIINELVTNSIKYGFPDERPGQILVKLHTNHELVISVLDNGVGMPGHEQARKGFGSKVVALLVQQLNGQLVYEDAQPGCRVVLRMPKPKL